jgi:site-specific recombinase XerD
MQPHTAWFGEGLTPLVTGFLLSKEAEGCSKCTLADYTNGLAHYGRWLQTEGLDPLGATPTHVKGFLAHLRTITSRRGRPLAPKSILNVYVALRSFYRWAHEDLGAENPMTRVPQPKVQPTLIQSLSREQVAAVLAATETTGQARTVGRRSFAMKRPTAQRDRAIILTLLDSGLRVGELCALRMQDLDLASGRLIIHKGKGGAKGASHIWGARRVRYCGDT